MLAGEAGLWVGNMLRPLIGSRLSTILVCHIGRYFNLQIGMLSEQSINDPMIRIMGKFAGGQWCARIGFDKKGDGSRTADTVFTMHHERAILRMGVHFANELANTACHQVVEHAGQWCWQIFVGRNGIVERQAQYILELRAESSLRRPRVGDRNYRHARIAGQPLDMFARGEKYMTDGHGKCQKMLRTRALPVAGPRVYALGDDVGASVDIDGLTRHARRA